MLFASCLPDTTIHTIAPLLIHPFVELYLRITSNFTEGRSVIMANKINAKLILELKASGLSRNQIAATRHMPKHFVSDVINIPKDKDIIYEKIKYLSEDNV